MTDDQALLQFFDWLTDRMPLQSENSQKHSSESTFVNSDQSNTLVSLQELLTNNSSILGGVINNCSDAGRKQIIAAVSEYIAQNEINEEERISHIREFVYTIV